jgi:RNA polymerase sigma factor (sigma-70 family)
VVVSYSTGVARVRSPEGPNARRVGEFELLYRSELATVTAFFARRTRDPQLVADLTADTFVEAMRSFVPHGPAHGSERPWLLTIARRVYAKHCERAARRRAAARRDLARQLLDADETEQLADRIDAERPGRELLESLAGLSGLDRWAVELVDLVGLTPKEAATVLDVSSGALRVRLFRARARLRKESGNDV